MDTFYYQNIAAGIITNNIDMLMKILLEEVARSIIESTDIPTEEEEEEQRHQVNPSRCLYSPRPIRTFIGCDVILPKSINTRRLDQIKQSILRL